MCEHTTHTQSRREFFLLGFGFFFVCASVRCVHNVQASASNLNTNSGDDMHARCDGMKVCGVVSRADFCDACMFALYRWSSIWPPMMMMRMMMCATLSDNRPHTSIANLYAHTFTGANFTTNYADQACYACPSNHTHNRM